MGARRPTTTRGRTALPWTYIDDRILELDVEPVVGDGDDGLVGTAQVLHPFPLQRRERYLGEQRNGRGGALMRSDVFF